MQFMSLGILIVGYLTMFIAGQPTWIYSGACKRQAAGVVGLSGLRRLTLRAAGLLGGSLWALGNSLVPFIIKFIGMGLGLLLWSVRPKKQTAAFQEAPRWRLK